MSDVSRVVLVTGAASGMGLVTSRQFLDSGDRVVAWDLDADGLKRAWGGARPERVLTATVDVAEPEATDAGIEQVLARFGRLDVVVNNAALHGAGWTDSCLALPPERCARVVGANALGVGNLARSRARSPSARSAV